jgi:DNA (cytosine-5)-methyltransferase 1
VDTPTINVLSICSGYGGIELGLQSVIPSRTVCYVEHEISVASILAARMADNALDPAPVWTDLSTFNPEPWRGRIHLLAGGFPCQPFSVAGKQLHGADSRELSGEVLRIAAGLGHPALFLENVPGILRFYWDNIRPRLREMGYQVAEGLFSAAEVGAPHTRQRLFILAHANSNRTHERPVSNGERGHARAVPEGRDSKGSQDQIPHAHNGSSEQRALADASGEGPQGIRLAGETERQTGSSAIPLFPPGPDDAEGWAYMLNVMPQALPTFCRESDGPASRVGEQLRAIGNGVVPSVAARAFETLSLQLNKK